MISEEIKNEINKICKPMQENLNVLKDTVDGLSKKIDSILKNESQNVYLSVLNSVGSYQKISNHCNTLIKIRNRSNDQNLNILINSLTKKLFENLQDPKCDFKTALESSTWVEVSALITYCKKNIRS